ncbi:MAG: ABC transporter ATP-binding protein [Geminicoccaceae bacterium]
MTIAISRLTPIVEDFSLTIKRGEIVALVGESGSGKSVTAQSLMGLLPAPLTTTGGRIFVSGDDIVGASPKVLDGIRGNKVGMIFQQPMSMLDPTSRIASQVGEALRIHGVVDRKTAWSKSIELLSEVGIPDPERRARSYSHQLSGGMAQRVMIACALSGNPDLLIADEPTTALDVTVQAQILSLLVKERQRRNLSILLITHDLSVVSAMVDRVVVMYAGRIVEEGPAEAVMRDPRHPYTAALVHCSLMQTSDTGDLYTIPGKVPQPSESQVGCRFHARCTDAYAGEEGSRCGEEEPMLTAFHRHRKVRCWAARRGGAETWEAETGVEAVESDRRPGDVAPERS